MGRKIPMWQILLVLAVLIACLMYTILYMTSKIGFEGYVHIALVTGGAFAAIIAIANGFKWSYLEKGIIDNIGRSMQAILILMTVGMLIGTWIAGGIVPAMIYYGLKILSPSIFLPACVIIAGIVAISTGSSWTTAGTIGVALIGVGTGLGMPLPITAGAIISGAYFGDKMSPLSDTTNLAPAMAGANLFEHIKHMVYTTGVSLVIALVLFAVIGMRYSGSADMSNVEIISNAIQDSFNINLLLLIPPLCVIAMVIFKVPALPGLMGGVVLGILFAVFMQGADFGEIATITAYEGFFAETGNADLDELLTGGGMESMYYTVGLIICAMTVGGVLDCTEMLKTLCEALLKFAKNTGLLVTLVVFTCFFVNFAASDQYLAIVLPGRMYKTAFEDRRLKAKNLSRCLEDSGTITSPLIPWNTCGSYMQGALGIKTVEYLPYCFFNLINPIVSIVFGFTGITMDKMTEEEYQAVLAQRELDAEIAARALEA